MAARRPVLIVGMVLYVEAAWGQLSVREPHLGYLYPAGGQQGTSFQVTIGGQNLHSYRSELTLPDSFLIQLFPL